MLFISIVLFILAALLGLYLLSYVLTDKNTPKGVAIIHGSFAVLGVLFLILYSIFYKAAVVSLILFIIAALGGILLVNLDVFGKKIPKPLAIGHGAIAIIAFLFLIAFAIFK